MANAGQEFVLHTLSVNSPVKCASLHQKDIYGYEDAPKYNLPVNWTKEEYKNFLYRLNFEYDEGYGCQLLFGTIWYEDGTWSERGEYDGSEWWIHQECPEIPQELNPA